VSKTDAQITSGSAAQSYAIQPQLNDRFSDWIEHKFLARVAHVKTLVGRWYQQGKRFTVQLQ
jgi:hypothetical protein